MSNAQRLSLGLAIFAGVIIAIGIWLNSGYGEVSSDTYQYSKALYSACLNENTDHLNKVEEMLLNAEDMHKHERNWLDAIVKKAQSGDWKSASKDARQMMEDQVEY